MNDGAPQDQAQWQNLDTWILSVGNMGWHPGREILDNEQWSSPSSGTVPQFEYNGFC